MKIKNIIAAAIVLMLAAGCANKQAPQDASPTGATKPVPTQGTEIAGIERIPSSEASKEDINTASAEKDFSGVWRAALTTSESAALEWMEIVIGGDSYKVSMELKNVGMTTQIEGTYQIKDGVLVFDDNFEDCTAYFYDGDDETLVVDNGISLMLCKRRETEEEMR